MTPRNRSQARARAIAVSRAEIAWRLGMLGAALGLGLVIAVAAQAQTQNGNEYNGLDHQPTPSQVFQGSPQQQQKVNNELDRLSNKLQDFKLPKDAQHPNALVDPQGQPAQN